MTSVLMLWDQTLDLARSFKLQVVAEGVETRRIWNSPHFAIALCAIGCRTEVIGASPSAVTSQTA